MPRPIWSGAISFGLVNVPVKVFSATSSKDVRFHQLDGKSKSRIKQKRVSVATGEEVPYVDLFKAYEIAPDKIRVEGISSISQHDIKVAAELGYHRNALVRGMIRQRSGIIGVVTGLLLLEIASCERDAAKS